MVLKAVLLLLQACAPLCAAYAAGYNTNGGAQVVLDPHAGGDPSRVAASSNFVIVVSNGTYRGLYVKVVKQKDEHDAGNLLPGRDSATTFSLDSPGKLLAEPDKVPAWLYSFDNGRAPEAFVLRFINYNNTYFRQLNCTREPHDLAPCVEKLSCLGPRNETFFQACPPRSSYYKNPTFELGPFIEKARGCEAVDYWLIKTS